MDMGPVLQVFMILPALTLQEFRCFFSTILRSDQKEG